jgi:glycosyltransferase involved in cell wall biosynthesis
MSAIRPCIVIPIYEHGSTIRAMVAALAALRLPVYIVDDGSGPATQQELARVRAEFPVVRLSRLPRNAGKGAAMMHGFRHARADGMTHALQLDADGQHDTGDVPRFLERAAARPDALVCGRAVFDDSVPRVRLHGRRVTHFWVRVETLSFDIEDALCGFRLYPLAATCRLIDEVAMPARYGFDTAAAVHLAWRGVPVENLPTRVTYPPGGLSHFRMLRDNLRLIAMHFGLLAGMCLRLPLLLRRRLGGPPRSSPPLSTP